MDDGTQLCCFENLSINSPQPGDGNKMSIVFEDTALDTDKLSINSPQPGDGNVRLRNNSKGYVYSFDQLSPTWGWKRNIHC